MRCQKKIEFDHGRLIKLADVSQWASTFAEVRAFPRCESGVRVCGWSFQCWCTLLLGASSFSLLPLGSRASFHLLAKNPDLASRFTLRSLKTRASLFSHVSIVFRQIPFIFLHFQPVIVFTASQITNFNILLFQSNNSFIQKPKTFKPNYLFFLFLIFF